VLQVRCIAAVLLMVGRGQERPDIVKKLLDVSLVPCKPQYNMAAEEPLLLYRYVWAHPGGGS
jgi:tRNA pseudouridine38/39 synthase